MKPRRAFLFVLLAAFSVQQGLRAVPSAGKITPEILRAATTLTRSGPSSPTQVTTSDFFTLNWEAYPGPVDGYFVLVGRTNLSYDLMANVGTNRTWRQEGMKEGVTNYFFIAPYSLDGTNVVFSPRAFEVNAVYHPDHTR